MKPPFPIFLSNTFPLDPYILALLLPHLIRRYIYLNSPVKTLQAPHFPVPPTSPNLQQVREVRKIGCDTDLPHLVRKLSSR